jgi:hypothetical protein
MKVKQLRATLDEFIAIYASEGHSESADALRGLSYALETADAKSVDEILRVLEDAGAVTDELDGLSLRQ